MIGPTAAPTRTEEFAAVDRDEVGNQVLRSDMLQRGVQNVPARPLECWRLAEAAIVRAARACEAAALERADTVSLLSAAGERTDRTQAETRVLLEQLLQAR